ncbi:MAG: DUF308 domain-containing protein [Lachnospiraceae bacterium]|nr:DUF308 domain-containing protein [Lachnospiraceae bacterium]
MMETLKNIKLHVIIAAILTVILGIVMIASPIEVNSIIAKTVAAIVVIVGAVRIIGGIMAESHKLAIILVGVLIVIIGVYLWTNPGFVISIIPVIIGIIMIFHGIQDMILAFEGRAFGGVGFVWMMLLGIISMILGAVCISNAFGVVALVTRILGIMLIYDGISDMFVVFRLNKSRSTYVKSKVIK